MPGKASASAEKSFNTKRRCRPKASLSERIENAQWWLVMRTWSPVIAVAMPMALLRGGARPSRQRWWQMASHKVSKSAQL